MIYILWGAFAVMVIIYIIMKVNQKKVAEPASQQNSAAPKNP